MITWNATGNLLDHCDGHGQVPVIATNCIGVMGAGIAGQYRTWDQRGFEHYATRCKLGQHSLDNPVMFVRGDKGLALCWATMHRPGTMGSLEAIDSGINTLLHQLPRLNEHYTFHIPRLGCGIGRLEWNHVAAVLRETLLDVRQRQDLFDAQREAGIDEVHHELVVRDRELPKAPEPGARIHEVVEEDPALRIEHLVAREPSGVGLVDLGHHLGLDARELRWSEATT